MVEDARRRALELDFWSEPVTLKPLSAGPTGHRFFADDGIDQYNVQIGDDLPELKICHIIEQACPIELGLHSSDLANHFREINRVCIYVELDALNSCKHCGRSRLTKEKRGTV